MRKMLGEGKEWGLLANVTAAHVGWKYSDTAILIKTT